MRTPAACSNASAWCEYSCRMPRDTSDCLSGGASASGKSANTPGLAGWRRMARTGDSGSAIHSSKRAMAPAKPVRRARMRSFCCARSFSGNWGSAKCVSFILRPSFAYSSTATLWAENVLYVGFQKLHFVQTLIDAAVADQLVVGARLGDAALIQHHDLVRTAHGGEPVGDHDHGAAGHQVLQRL